MQLYKVIVGETTLPGEFAKHEAERKKASLKLCVNDEIQIVPVKQEPQLQGGKRDA